MLYIICMYIMLYIIYNNVIETLKDSEITARTAYDLNRTNIETDTE